MLLLVYEKMDLKMTEVKVDTPTDQPGQTGDSPLTTIVRSLSRIMHNRGKGKLNGTHIGKYEVRPGNYDWAIPFSGPHPFEGNLILSPNKGWTPEAFEKFRAYGYFSRKGTNMSVPDDVVTITPSEFVHKHCLLPADLHMGNKGEAQHITYVWNGEGSKPVGILKCVYIETLCGLTRYAYHLDGPKYETIIVNPSNRVNLPLTLKGQETLCDRPIPWQIDYSTKAREVITLSGLESFALAVESDALRVPVSRIVRERRSSYQPRETKC
jgi:hypothetical protein